MLSKKKKYLIMAMVGLIIALLIDGIISFDHPHHNRLYDFILSILLTVIIWEENLFVERKLEAAISWSIHPLRRIFVQLLSGISLSVFTIFIGMFIYSRTLCELDTEQQKSLFITSIIIGTLFSIIMTTVEIGARFFSNWKHTLVEVEKYKAETLQAQLQNLKNQINPHFLFNNLSVLSSLVYKDQDKAADFINQLSKVYRYLLDNRNHELVTVQKELDFIQSYIYLLQIRFGKNILFEQNVNSVFSQHHIPPMALQLLIENAIKHNEISNELPLTISIYTEQEIIVVKNNLQLRSNKEETSKTGLQNIKDRYAYFTSKQIEVENKGDFFIVKIPLLKA